MRKIVPLNDHWSFVHENIPLSAQIPQNAEIVTLPHCWNAVDGHDGHSIDLPTKDWASGDLSGKTEDRFDRGSYWYYREFDAPSQPLAGGRLYIEIPAAGQQAVVYVNGQIVTSHEGGYSAFRADITDYLKETGANFLAIQVSNEYRTKVYPHHADFTFYGGLYRGVNLISVAKSHFDLDYYGGPGMTVTPRLAENGGAEFQIQAFAVHADETFTISYTIEDMDGREVGYALRPADQAEIAMKIPCVNLWSPSSPYLYSVRASLIRRNEVYDEITLKCGVRSFSCTPDEGFFLNGKSLPLRGVSRHQDKLYQGNALTKEDHYADARIIKELGANSIRLAHYQHAQDFYDACDELGFVVWAEIPFITIMNKDPAAHENCISQMRELIIQNYHHPSICFWGLSNEVLLGGKLSEKLVDNHKELEKLVKSLDPTRLTTIAHVSDTPGDCGLHGITDVEAYNHYFGWYVGKMQDNGPWLDEYHTTYPDHCIGMSEYGCEGILTYHSAEPQVKDYSEEYQALYHEELAKVFDERPWVWCSYVWNMFDFGAAARNEGGVSGRNNKGLMTLDRKIKKDSYYIYQAYWNPKPMVHICGKRYAQRAGETTEIRIYSNLPKVSLYLNGEFLETKESDGKVFVFRVSLKDGLNTITADAFGKQKGDIRSDNTWNGGSKNGNIPDDADAQNESYDRDHPVVQDHAWIEKTEKEPAVYHLSK